MEHHGHSTLRDGAAVAQMSAASAMKYTVGNLTAVKQALDELYRRRSMVCTHLHRLVTFVASLIADPEHHHGSNEVSALRPIGLAARNKTVLAALESLYAAFLRARPVIQSAARWLERRAGNAG